MRILITGATGFIGRALTAHLVGLGYRVTAWVRDAVKARAALGGNVDLAVGDAAGLRRAVGAVDAIINLAGEPVMGRRWTADRKQRIVTSRLELTRAIVDGIHEVASRPQVLISASAVGYYGDCGSAIVADEHPAGTDFLAQLCRDWEAAAMGARAAGVRVFIPRIGIVLARDGGALAPMIMPFRLGLGGPIGSGEQYIPWIHRRDLIELIARALDDARYEGPMIAAAPNPVTNREFVRTLARALHRPCVMAVPAFALRMVLGEAAAPLLTGQRVEPKRLTEAGFVWHYTTIEAALNDLVASS